MKQQMIVTNVRMPMMDWLQVKNVAADMGMSVNEYLNTIAHADATEKSVGMKRNRAVSKKHFLEAIEHIAHLPNKPMGELSAEDKIIYGE
ncbi:MAG: hypothetical protein AAB457_01215 [Patescibacteria group bacterium]